MKKILIAIGLVAALLVPALAADSFNATNTITYGVTLTPAGTNSVTTNGFAAGYPIGVQNYDRLGLVVSGNAGGTAAGNIVVTLARSADSGAPSNFETTPTWSFTVAMPTTAGAPLYAVTNLPDIFAYPANYVVIATVTNTANGNALTNAFIGLNKKIIPIRYP